MREDIYKPPPGTYSLWSFIWPPLIGAGLPLSLLTLSVLYCLHKGHSFSAILSPPVLMVLGGVYGLVAILVAVFLPFKLEQIETLGFNGFADVDNGRDHWRRDWWFIIFTVLLWPLLALYDEYHCPAALRKVIALRQALRESDASEPYTNGTKRLLKFDGVPLSPLGYLQFFVRMLSELWRDPEVRSSRLCFLGARVAVFASVLLAVTILEMMTGSTVVYADTSYTYQSFVTWDGNSSPEPEVVSKIVLTDGDRWWSFGTDWDAKHKIGTGFKVKWDNFSVKPGLVLRFRGDTPERLEPEIMFFTARGKTQGYLYCNAAIPLRASAAGSVFSELGVYRQLGHSNISFGINADAWVPFNGTAEFHVGPMLDIPLGKKTNLQVWAQKGFNVGDGVRLFFVQSF